MSGIVDLVVQRVRLLTGGRNDDKNSIIGQLAIVNDEMASQFQSFGFKFETQVVVLGDIAPNTTDLSAQQAQGQPLFDLVTPEAIDWKLTGQPEVMWKPVSDLPRVVDTNMGSGLAGSPVQSVSDWVDSYEWRGGTIFISPCALAVDLRVRGQFMPNMVDNDATDPIRAAVNILAFFTAAAILFDAGGPDSKLGLKREAQGMKSLANFQSNMSKARQGKLMRLGGRRTGTRSGFPPPVDRSS